MQGKITGLTKFGAFVSLPDGKSGMVHISEITTTYVSDIKDYLSEGQEITVKLIGIDKEGRINLSIRKVTDAAPCAQVPASAMLGRTPDMATAAAKEISPFDAKLKAFLSESESRMADLKHQADRRGGGVRRSRTR